MKNVQCTEFCGIKDYFKTCLEDSLNKLLTFQNPQVPRVINPKGEL